MKEYTVVKTNLGLVGRVKKLDSILNTHASQGWEFKYMDDHATLIVFERSKNRH